MIAINKLPIAKRTQILAMLCEGSSMRSISRVADVSINTVSKLLVDAGTACAAFHDATVRGVTAKRVQCDEIWSFTYAERSNAGQPTNHLRGPGPAAGLSFTFDSRCFARGVLSSRMATALTLRFAIDVLAWAAIAAVIATWAKRRR